MEKPCPPTGGEHYTQNVGRAHPGRAEEPARSEGKNMAKIKIDKELMKKIKRYSKIAGYSSEEEFVVHTLEKQISQLEETDSEEEVKKKLQGLGYIS
jgi:hypothetical protein